MKVKFKLALRTILIFFVLLLYSLLLCFLIGDFALDRELIRSNLHLIWLFETQLKFPIENLFTICGVYYAVMAFCILLISLVYKGGRLWFVVLLPLVFVSFGFKDKFKYKKNDYSFKDSYIYYFYREYFSDRNHIFDIDGNLIIRGGDGGVCHRSFYDKRRKGFRLEKYIKGDTLVGFCDMNGNIIFPCKYILKKMSHELIRAYDKDIDKVGILNTDYEFILPCEYKGLTTYEDYIRLYNNKDLVGLIDYDMNIRVPFDYSNIVRLDGTQPSLGLFLVLYKGKAGVYSINKHEEIIPCIYRRIEAGAGFIKIRDNSDNYWGGYGACDYNGNKIVPCEYCSITKKEGVLWCEKEDKDSYAYKYDKYDLQGNYLGEDN